MAVEDRRELVGHADTAVRGTASGTRDAARVHADTVVRQTQEKGHGCSLESAACRYPVAPHLGVRFNELSLAVIDLSVQIRFLVGLLFDHRKPTGRCRVLAEAGGDSSPPQLLPTTEKTRLLFVNADFDMRDRVTIAVPCVKPFVLLYLLRWRSGLLLGLRRRRGFWRRFRLQEV